MPYHFITERESHSDLASGSVIRSLPGETAFPVRLAREMYEQARAHRSSEGFGEPCTLYDPCCGGGYLLTTLGIIYNSDMSHVIASDVSTREINLAKANLTLITAQGLEARINELDAKYTAFGKESYLLALKSARSFRHKLVNPTIHLHTFQADARSEAELRKGLNNSRPDIVISDLPYGSSVYWRDVDGATIDATAAIHQMLSALYPLLTIAAVVALSTGKRHKIAHSQYRRLRQMTIGKRRITWLRRE